jgi:DNA polymerase-4
MQMSLFDNKAEKLNLYKTVDEIKNQFGSHAVTKAVTFHLNEGTSHHTTRHNKKKEAE